MGQSTPLLCKSRLCLLKPLSQGVNLSKQVPQSDTLCPTSALEGRQAGLIFVLLSHRDRLHVSTS